MSESREASRAAGAHAGAPGGRPVGLPRDAPPHRGLGGRRHRGGRRERGSFYYHFADLDHLVAWALSQELLNSDRAGHSFLVLAAQQERPEETPAVSRSLARVGLLLDRGGMSSVFEVTLDAMLRLWRDALCAEGEELPDEVVAQLEYAVGGTVGDALARPLLDRGQAPDVDGLRPRAAPLARGARRRGAGREPARAGGAPGARPPRDGGVTRVGPDPLALLAAPEGSPRKSGSLVR